MLSTAMDNGYRDYIVPPSSMIRGLPSQLGSLPPTPSFTNSSDRNWHTATFPATQMMPSGRGEVSKLRTWLENELSNLSLNTSAELYEFSETALSLYNLSFQEITRQVRPHGRLQRGQQSLIRTVPASVSPCVGRVLSVSSRTCSLLRLYPPLLRSALP